MNFREFIFDDETLHKAIKADDDFLGNFMEALQESTHYTTGHTNAEQLGNLILTQIINPLHDVHLDELEAES